MEDHGYSAADIQVMEGLQAVRKRPSMYIGSTDTRGLHHLVYEVVDNSIDEALAGYCTEIKVEINKDNSVTVTDNGRGIPVDIHPKYNKPGLEIVMTVLHSGGKFGSRAYKVSGGLHGVGVHVVNALSEYLLVEVKRDGYLYRQRYERGKPVTPVEKVGAADGRGTKVTFKPDPEIFEVLEFDFGIISRRMRELAFLNKGVRMCIIDHRTGVEKRFCYEGGIVSFIEYVNTNKNVIHPDIIYFGGTSHDIIIEFAIQYTEDYVEHIFTFANNINTADGGTHLTGFRAALTKVMNDFARKRGVLKNDAVFTGEDVREGITAVISVKVPNPQFEGQTKTRLGNSEVRGIVERFVNDKLSQYFEEHPKTIDAILQKCLLAMRVREEARRVKELTRRKSVLSSASLPGKLADCTERDPSKAEIFIVEGDSAGGSAKQGRDRTFQAILPLRGKILNVEKSRLHKALKNAEIEAMITALGCGIGDEFDILKLRYHKIIIMTDADVDGAHIRTLLLTFFYRYMRPLIDNGHVYIAQPPLYRVYKGKKERYCYTEEEKDAALKELGEHAEVQRYKGLGEMNPHQLWETTMDPKTRILKQVTIENAIEADKLFTVLMGDQVEPRREFIATHAKEVVNLDI